MEQPGMVNKKTWDEFRQAGLLWFINSILHTFGWAIVVDLDDATDKVTGVYPARVKFRGFGVHSTTEGFIKIHKYMLDNAKELYEESLK
jgi:hypothetical protein